MTTRTTQVRTVPMTREEVRLLERLEAKAQLGFPSLGYDGRKLVQALIVRWNDAAATAVDVEELEPEP